jgi:hypothetical protein
VRYLPRPRIALAYNTPTSASAVGWLRYLIEQRYGYPVTTIRTEQLRNADLSRYNVIILPDSSGNYSQPLGDGAFLREWTQRGGVLIGIAGAANWLTEERVNLLPTKREKRDGAKGEKKETEAPKDQPSVQAKDQGVDQPRNQPKTPAKDQPKEQPKELAKEPTKEPAREPVRDPIEKAIEPTDEFPSATPGAIVRVRIDRRHWLGFGYGETVPAMVDSNRIFSLIKLDRGTNVGVYAPPNEMLLSGFMWDDARRQLPNKAYLMHAPLGRGHVIAFAEDPNYRAFMDGLNLLMLNAVLLGPGH